MEFATTIPIEILEAAATAILTIQDDRILHANAAAIQLTGYSRETLENLPFTSLFRSDFHELIRELLKSDQRGQDEVIVICAGQVPCPVELTLAPTEIQPHTGSPQTVWVATLLPAQGSRKAEGRSPQWEGLAPHWRQFLDALPHAVCYLDSARRIVYANKMQAYWWAMSPEEAKGKHLSEVLNEEAYRIILPYSSRALAGERVEFEATIPRAAIAPQRILAVLIPDVQPSGKVEGYFVLTTDVTSKYRAEQELRQREAQISQITTTIQDVFYVYDIAPAKFIYVSPAFEQIWGRPVDDLKDNAALFLSTLHPDDYDATVADTSRRLTSPQPSQFEYRIVRPDGTVRWIEHRSYPAINETGQVYRLIGSARDVTAQKAAEAAQQQSEERLRVVISNLPVILFTLDTKGIFTFSDGLSLQSLGLRPHELVGTSAHEMYRAVPDFSEDVDNALKGQTVTRERTYGGLTFQTHLMPLLSKDGQVDGVVGLGIDITDRKRAQEALQDREARLRTVIESSPIGIAITSGPEGHIIQVNPAFCTMTGYSAEELFSMSVKEITLPDDFEREEALINELREGKRRHYEMEKRYKRRDGTSFPVRLVSAPLGNTWDAVGLVEDISERKHLQELTLEQEKLKVTLQKEQELSELKTKMMMRLAHEFRTPLSVISTSTHLLRHYFERLTVDQRDEQFAQIDRQIEVLSRMLENLAFVVRGEFDRLPFRPMVFDAEQLLRAIISEAQHVKGMTHSINFQTQGDPQHLRQVHVDMVVLRLVLTNLLSNAIKFSNDRTVVDVVARATDHDLTIEVGDQGFGILPEEEKRIYEPFYRGSNFDERPGLGIGLSIVKQAVEIHGGSISFVRNIRGGVTFTAHLPFPSKAS